MCGCTLPLTRNHESANMDRHDADPNVRDKLGRRAGDRLCGVGVGAGAAGGSAAAPEGEPFLKTRSLLAAARSRLAMRATSVRAVDSSSNNTISSDTTSGGSSGDMDGVSCGSADGDGGDGDSAGTTTGECISRDEDHRYVSVGAGWSLSRSNTSNR